MRKAFNLLDVNFILLRLFALNRISSVLVLLELPLLLRLAHDKSKSIVLVSLRRVGLVEYGTYFLFTIGGFIVPNDANVIGLVTVTDCNRQ